MEQAESLAAQSLNNYAKSGGYNSYEQLLQLNGNYFPDCLSPPPPPPPQHRPSNRHLGQHILHSGDKDPSASSSYENNNALSPAI